MNPNQNKCTLDQLLEHAESLIPRRPANKVSHRALRGIQRIGNLSGQRKLFDRTR